MLLTIMGSLKLLKALAGSYLMHPKLSHLQAEPAPLPQEVLQPWLSVASTDLTPVQHLSWTEVGGKIEHSISVVAQQVPSKGE